MPSPKRGTPSRFICLRGSTKIPATDLPSLNPQVLHMSAAASHLVYHAIKAKDLGDPAFDDIDVTDAEAADRIRYALQQIGWTGGEGQQNFFFLRFGPVVLFGIRVQDLWIIALAGTRPKNVNELGINVRSGLAQPSSTYHGLLIEAASKIKQPRGCALHSGYYYLGNLVFCALADVLEPKLHATDNIVLTGHSLGGATAMTVAACLTRDERLGRSWPLQCVYTFGMPMFGIGSLTPYIGVPHFRIVQNTDVVQDYPFTRLALFAKDYHHDSHGYILSKTGLTRCAYAGKRRVKSRYTWAPSMLKYHHMCDYLEFAELYAKSGVTPAATLIAPKHFK